MKKPLVVIVGRPNVGKSTLFNRLTDVKDAIVHDFSGVTRDRNYGEVEWTDKRFRLIDTGGYVPDTPDLFEKVIREQIDLAVTESDKIIFLVDGRDGITPVDENIAGILRNSGKPTFLCVNKIDGENQDLLIHDFYSLGLGEPYPLAAINGRGLGDFLDLLTEGFPTLEEIEEENDESRLKIAIVGRPNVGKSSLTNALLGYDRSIVTDIPGTTRDSVDSILKYYGEEIVLIDTAGLRRRSRVRENIEYFSTVRSLKSIGEATVAILLIDAAVGFHHQDQKIIDEAVRRRKGLIIAVNKWDLIEKDQNTAKKFEDELRHKLGSIDYVPVLFISALTKQRIFKLIKISKEIHVERLKKIPTSELNDILLPEIAKTPPPATGTGREVSIKFINQVGDKYPIFLFFTNYPKYISDSYRRFLEKRIRAHFGFYGVPMTLSFKQK